MIQEKIAIIGIGNMGKAIAYSLQDSKTLSEQDLILIERDSKNKTENIKEATIIIFAVKPQNMTDVLQEYQGLITKEKLVLSIAAGVNLKTISKYLKGVSIIRVMPNLCLKVGQSMSCWVKNKLTTLNQVELVKMILKSFGQELELKDESTLDKVTAISGSGPAYFTFLSEILIKTAIKLNIEPDDANIIVRQTLIGTAEYLKKNEDVVLFRESVTSKGGITEAAIKHFKSQGLEKIMSDGVKSGLKRAKELAKGKIGGNIA